MVLLDSIKRPCLVYFYTGEERNGGRTPAPDTRQGTADCFYIVYGEIDSRGLRLLARPHLFSLEPGSGPQEATVEPEPRVIVGFCGGDSFARGIGAGDAAEVAYFPDLLLPALTTRFG